MYSDSCSCSDCASIRTLRTTERQRSRYARRVWADAKLGATMVADSRLQPLPLHGPVREPWQAIDPVLVWPAMAQLVALSDVECGARLMAENGEAVDGYIALSGAVRAYLTGASPEDISDAGFIH